METLARIFYNHMALFNQLTLYSILNSRNNLGTLELKAAVASMTEEQKDDAFIFLECNTKELVGRPDRQGMQAVANICTLLDCLPTEHYDKISLFMHYCGTC